MAAPYSVLDVDPDSIIGDEPLGSKSKFWFLHDGEKWLFKEARVIPFEDQELPTGEDWAEKVAAEIAARLDIPAAEVELAVFRGRPGCASRNFVRDTTHHLMHGNEVLAGHVPGYDRHKQQHQSDHTLENIVTAIQQMFPAEEDNRSILTRLAGYLVLDALIGNVDRHHENWGLIWTVQVHPDDFRETAKITKEFDVAPSFDHASSLGRELRDEQRLSILRSDGIEKYVRRGHGGVYRRLGDRQGANPLELVEVASRGFSSYFLPALSMLRQVPLSELTDPLDRVPDHRISVPACNFAEAMLTITYNNLCKLAL